MPAPWAPASRLATSVAAATDAVAAKKRRRDVTGAFLCVQSTQSFHMVDVDDSGLVRQVRGARDAGLWINGGFFIFKRSIFEVMGPGEELVEQPFHRLIEKGQLAAYPHDGFWACMDTFKEKQQLDDLLARGDAPWEVWRGAS